MMKANRCTRFLLLPLTMLFYYKADAQNIRGDTIFLEINKVVSVIFPSDPTKYDLLPTPDGQENVYEVNLMGKNTISILAKKKGKDQDLEIAEKDRKHLFILSYKEGSRARSEDFSTRKKLAERAAVVRKRTLRSLKEADSLYTQAEIDTTNQSLWKIVEEKYQGLVKLVEGNDLEYVKLRVEESRKQTGNINEMKYSEAMKQGQSSYAAKRYRDARNAYMQARGYKPGDEQSLKYIDLTDSAWAKSYIDQGDDAMKKKDFISAKTAYQESINIKPDYPGLKEKFEQAKVTAAPLIFKAEKEKGDKAVRMSNWADARRAYDSALLVQPADKEVKAALKKVIAELEKVQQEEKKEGTYQGILAIAKSLADKASNVQEYDLAIKEYRRALAMNPDRKFPMKKIAELTLKKKTSK